jgi:HTH-type transcriptional regulator/antitoxin HigA
MDIRAIRTKLDYRRTLKEIETLMDATPNTPKGERLDVLVALIESYERRHYALDLPDPVEAIKFRMEQMGLVPKDLEPMIGRLNRVYEVLNRKRPLTMKMAWHLHCELGIPAESLIRPPADYRAA